MHPGLPLDEFTTEVHRLTDQIYYFPHFGLFAESPIVQMDVRGVGLYIR